MRCGRLVFHEQFPREREFRIKGLAELFLDTPLFNAHTTAGDVLWSGVPIVSIPGENFAQRVAAGGEGVSACNLVGWSPHSSCGNVFVCSCVCVCARARACVRACGAGLQSHAGRLKAAQTRAYIHARTHAQRTCAHTHTRTPIARAHTYNRRDAQIRGPRPAAHCAQPRRLRGSSHAPRGTPTPPPRSCCRPSRCSLSVLCGHIGALLSAFPPAHTQMGLLCLSA